MSIGAPASANFCRSRGDTFPFTITFTDSSGSAIDITGFTYLLTVDPDPDPSDATNNLFQNTPVVTDGPNGVITVTLTPAQADQTPDLYFFDLQQTDTGGFVRTVLKGEWEVVQDVTK